MNSLFIERFRTAIYCCPTLNPYIKPPLPSTPPGPHNKHSNIQYQFLSVQITAARHAIKTDCGVGVTAFCNTCCDILVMVGDPACKSGSPVS